MGNVGLGIRGLGFSRVLKVEEQRTEKQSKRKQGRPDLQKHKSDGKELKHGVFCSHGGSGFGNELGGGSNYL